ncbi:hypothetical protein M1857_11840 [Lactiplantibacillus plantarum]|uniref:hypothetical protein n=1 Tax=Lactiplantibacillus plantarum TaxID=1590 RepID=UPI001C56FB3C|nr:hypothetical protein [Lactiplantibacillus plantarum]MBW1620096.1 hypothetical protein [Lactiplantibacillus plantarum]WHQ53713.1 hypothetical protein M1857_11840 [Lactiplantibacillus plantarum]
MKRKEPINDHIDSAELLKLVRSVEDRHAGSVVSATNEEMEPIWKLCRTPARPGRHKVLVTQEQYWVIEAYSKVPVHTSEQKQSAVNQLGHNYWWLSRRVHEYRLGTLEVEE